MINQDSQQYKNWIAKLAENPPKLKGLLMKADFSEGCCLGWACVANKLVSEEIIDGGKYYLTFAGDLSILPPILQIDLNIKSEGNFTEKGARFVNIWLRENNIKTKQVDIFYLTGLNDETNATQEQIGELIQHLAWIEKVLGVECFELDVQN